MRKQFCQACSFARSGVRTRRYIPCTCGNELRPVKKKQQYVPTHEEVEKYIARLKELMEDHIKK